MAADQKRNDPNPDGLLVDIGVVIERTGLPASTLHHWERKGLIQSAGRSGLRRQYAPDIIERLAFVVLCQRGQFALESIVELMADIEVGTKDKLQQQLGLLIEERRGLDASIEALDHALQCPEPLPYECPGLRAKLAGAFGETNSHDQTSP